LKIISVFVIALLALLCFFGCGEVENAVSDRADALSAADEAKIMSAVRGAGSSRFFVVIYDSRADGFFDGRAFLRTYGLDREDNAVIFVADVKGDAPVYSAHIYGRAADRMPYGGLDLALSEIAREKNIAVAAEKFIVNVNSEVALPWLSIIVIALVSGVVIGGIVCGIAVARYKMKIRPTNYPLEHYTRLNLTEREDRFLNRHVTKVRVQSSSNKKK
jgi:hypothetical protein